MKPTVEEKRQREKQVVQEMIRLYCRKQHGSKGDLCPDCQALLAYAQARPVPLYGTQDLLFQLQGPLLPARDAGEDPPGHALLWPPDVVPPPGDGPTACYREQAGEKAPGKGGRYVAASTIPQRVWITRPGNRG